MQKVTSLILTIGLLSCSPSSHRTDSSDSTPLLVPISYVTDLEFVRKYENKAVLFVARFERLLLDAQFAGIEKHRFTDFLVSLESENRKTSLPNVLIPANNLLLPSLKSGDLVQVKGVLHLRLDEYIYLVVTELRRLKS